MTEFVGCLTLQKNKEPEDSLRRAGVHRLLSWFPVSVGVSEAADSNIFGLGSREEKNKKTFIQSEAETERQTQVTHSACLCEDKTGLVVNLENLLDGVDVRCRP